MFNIFQESDTTNTNPNSTPVIASPRENPCSPATSVKVAEGAAGPQLMETVVVAGAGAAEDGGGGDGSNVVVAYLDGQRRSGCQRRQPK